MTIKPIIKNQKSKDDSSEESNLGGTINSPNREKRKSAVFEDGNGSRHVRRTPQKSSNRMKRDHQKRLEADNKSTYGPLGVNVSATATSSLGRASSPNAATGSSSAVQVVGQSGDLKGEETPSGYNSGDEHHGRDAGLTENEWKQRDEEFVKLMANEKLIVKEIEEDGACLFRSISLQIYGDQDMHEDIRHQTMDYISQNREYFAQFLTEDIAGYISRKRKKNVHGNHIEIQAISEIYNRPVELYCYQSKPINIFNAEQRNNGYEPLRLSYQRSSHYNAILDPYKASVGVGLGLAGYQPDNLDVKQVQQAVRVSEELQIEQTMFEDKLKTTDWEATNEAIEEQIARESYLQWCRENMQRTKKSVSSTVTSQSSLSMPGSSGGSGSGQSSMMMMIGSATSSSNLPNTTPPITTTQGSGECNINSSNSAAPTSISCDGGASSVAVAAAAIGGRMSPQQQQQYQSDDGFKCSSGSSTCTSTASSSSSSGSSSLLGSGGFEGSRQRRRRRRHNHHNNAHSGSAEPRIGGDVVARVSPPGIGALNLAETRSTDSNDSDFSDETISKKMKRRLVEQDGGEGERTEQTSQVNNGNAEAEEQVAAVEPEKVGDRHSGSSVELTEPGPSKCGPAKEPVNFYHSLLESSYMDDGTLQMSEEEMIQRAIQMSRIDYITKQQKHSDYDSP